MDAMVCGGLRALAAPPYILLRPWHVADETDRHRTAVDIRKKRGSLRGIKIRRANGRQYQLHPERNQSQHRAKLSPGLSSPHACRCRGTERGPVTSRPKNRTQRLRARRCDAGETVGRDAATLGFLSMGGSPANRRPNAQKEGCHPAWIYPEILPPQPP